MERGLWYDPEKDGSVRYWQTKVREKIVEI
jgi:hypothetical protein